MSERKTPPAEKRAASLQYDGKSAPIITSAASGELAEEIIDPRDTRSILCEFANDAVKTLEPGKMGVGFRP